MESNACVVHCEKQQCNEQIVHSLLRELRIRRIFPLDVLINITNDLLEGIVKTPSSDSVVLLHVCKHSKKKLIETTKKLEKDKDYVNNIFVFGTASVDFKSFRKFHCTKIHHEIDIYKFADLVQKHNGIRQEGENNKKCSDPRRLEIEEAPSFADFSRRARSLDRRHYNQFLRPKRTQSADAIRHNTSLQVIPDLNLTTELAGELKQREGIWLQEDNIIPGTNVQGPPINTHLDSTDNNELHFTTVDCFVDGVLLQNKNEMTGTFVNRTSPSQQVRCDIPMERKLQLYRQNAGYEEYHKDIVTHIIPELRKRKDVRCFSDWLRFDEYHIKEKILLEMENLLLSVPMNDITIFDVTYITNNILNCCFQTEIQADDTLCLPLRVLTLCFAIVYILSSKTANTDAYLLVQNLSTRARSDINSLKKIPYSMAASQINVLVSLLEFFSTNSFQKNMIENALSQTDEKNVLGEFVQLEYPSKFIYVFMLINKILQNSSEKTEELLSVVLKSTFDTMSKRQATRQQLQPLLHIINKGITLRLLQGPERDRNWSETKRCLLTCVATYVTSGRVDLTWRGKMLDCLHPLLFVADKDIVKEIIKMFEKCGQKHKHIRNIIIKHVQSLLSAVNLRLFCFQKGIESSDKPIWSEFPGQIWNGLGVTLHLLLPTVKCLTNGSMEDYRALADEKQTRRQVNCLEIMRLLQYDKSHPNILKLIGYQYRPLPLFYLTEFHKNFHTYLLEKRQYHKWLSRTRLGHMAIDMIDAVQYLHSKGVVHRNLTTHSFSITEQDIIKLHDFSLAKILPKTDTDVNNFINAVNDGDVPFLYSAPESVLKDKYDFLTDIWMVGLLLYGLYTHGGTPYTVDGLDSEQILEYIIFQDLKPTKWPCIPMDVFRVIMSCMHSNPENREDLNIIKSMMKEHLTGCNQAKHDRLSSLFEVDKMYPPPACTEPEKGLPPLFSRLKQDLNPRGSYYNIRSSVLRPTKCCITLSDVTPPDPPIRNGHEHSRYMAVEEPVTQAFVEDELPQLSEHVCSKVLKMMEMPAKIKRNGNKIYNFDYILHYKCNNGENVIDMALRNHFGAPGIDSTDIMYIGLVYNLVKFVQRMHFHQWLLRDLCGYSIFVDTKTLAVFMPRIGRFRRMNTSVKLDDCILDDIFAERTRWLPIEVLQHGQYSKESDIYMLGMTIWEIYTALDLCRDNPTANPLEGKPFATIPKEELLTELYSGEIPDMPSSCPLWLFELLKCCWNRNRTFRPSADHMLEELKSRIHQHPRSDKLTQMVDLKPLRSSTLTRSQQKNKLSSTKWDESPYLSIVHVGSRTNSIETLDDSQQTRNTAKSISTLQTKAAAGRILQLPDNGPDEDYPKLRCNRGRVQPMPAWASGIYQNGLESDVLNVSACCQSHSLSPETISEDDETIESRFVEDSKHSGHVQIINGEENVDDLFKLSRVDSGIEDDVSNKRRSVESARSIPAIPVRNPGSIPPIPIPKIPTSKSHNNDSGSQLEARKCKSFSNSENLPQHHNRLENKGARDDRLDNQDRFVNLGVSTPERRRPSRVSPMSFLRSKDDSDIIESEPKLERFGSCYLLRAKQMSMFTQSLNKRESHV